MAAILDDEKVCTHCAQSQPLECFVRRSRAQNQRLSWCKGCRNEAARQLTARKRAAILGSAAKYVRHNTPASRVEATVAAACRKAGGIEQFAHCIQEAFDSPSANIRFAATMFMIKLLLALDRLRLAAAKSPNPFAHLSAQELTVLVQQHFIDALVNKPESMADALRALGWQVAPPCAKS